MILRKSIARIRQNQVGETFLNIVFMNANFPNFPQFYKSDEYIDLTAKYVGWFFLIVVSENTYLLFTADGTIYTYSY